MWTVRNRPSPVFGTVRPPSVSDKCLSLYTLVFSTGNQVFTVCRLVEAVSGTGSRYNNTGDSGPAHVPFEVMDEPPGAQGTRTVTPGQRKMGKVDPIDRP